MNEAFSHFQQRIKCSTYFKPDFQQFAAVLKSCAANSDIKHGKALHSHALKLGHVSFMLVSKALLNMYGKCKALEDCQTLFGQTSQRDAVTWNILLSGFVGSRVHDPEVISLFRAMHSGYDDPMPNSITIAIVLPVCARLRALSAGKSVHAYAVKSGLESQTLVGNALLSMYAKCGFVRDDASAVFHGIKEKDVVSWNAMISGFSENNFVGETFNLFIQMVKVGLEPNYATFANILPVCAVLEENSACRYGKEIHCYVMRRTEMITDVSVDNALVSFYSKIGRMAEAEILFQKMKRRDVVSWNAIIAGYALNNKWLKAIKLFQELINVAMIAPDAVTLLSILTSCAHSGILMAGKEMHGYIIKHLKLQEDTAVGNALLSFYSKCGDTEAAYHVFLSMDKRDLISWNAILDAFAESQLETDFVQLLRCMFQLGIRPDSVTILSAVQFFASVLRMHKVKEVHGFSIRSGILLADNEPTLGNALIDAYAKCDHLEYAFKVFENLSMRRNVVTCNSIISGYVNFGSHDCAEVIFKSMSERDLTTWNLMIRVYAENNFPDQALLKFHELQNHRMKPDAMTIMSILPVCAEMASVQLLRQCHGFVIRAYFDDVRLTGAILDVYSKCGSLSSAYNLFRSTPQKDLIMSTAMVGGYAIHGKGEDALRVYYHMLDLGVKPDHVIITAVLSACSHAGLVDDGLKIFYSIQKVHGIKPTMEQYACVVDMLSRGGRIDDAYSFATGMPIEPNANIWGTLLGACRNHHEVEMGRAVADRLFETESSNMGNYVVMSNLYAANAKWEGVQEIRRLMRTRDLKKPAGCSWIEVEGRKNVFVAADTSHPVRSTIYSTLCTLDKQVKELV